MLSTACSGWPLRRYLRSTPIMRRTDGSEEHYRVRHEFIHEGTVIVEVNAPAAEGKQRPGTCSGSDHKAAFSRPHRHAFGPTRGDINQHHCLYEAAG